MREWKNFIIFQLNISFSGPLILSCDIHNSFLFYKYFNFISSITKYKWDRKSREEGSFPMAQRQGSEVFTLESRPLLWGSFFQILEAIFLGFSLWEFDGALRHKAHKSVGCPLRLKTPGVSHSHTIPHSVSSNSSKLSPKCSYEVMATAAFNAGKQISFQTLWIYLSFQVWDWHLPCKFCSMMSIRK